MNREQRRKKKAPDTGQGAGAAGSGQTRGNPTGTNPIYKLPQTKACAFVVTLGGDPDACCLCGLPNCDHYPDSGILFKGGLILGKVCSECKAKGRAAGVIPPRLQGVQP
jgi:hypothetical protein